jgi:hypothetical protein
MYASPYPSCPVGRNVAVFPCADKVTEVPPCNASMSLRAFSSLHATSANWVVTRCNTAEPCASICCTMVVTCVSASIDVIVVDCCVLPDTEPLDDVLPERVPDC